MWGRSKSLISCVLPKIETVSVWYSKAIFLILLMVVFQFRAFMLSPSEKKTPNIFRWFTFFASGRRVFRKSFVYDEFEKILLFLKFNFRPGCWLNWSRMLQWVGMLSFSVRMQVTSSAYCWIFIADFPTFNPGMWGLFSIFWESTSERRIYNNMLRGHPCRTPRFKGILAVSWPLIWIWEQTTSKRILIHFWTSRGKAICWKRSKRKRWETESKALEKSSCYKVMRVSVSETYSKTERRFWWTWVRWRFCKPHYWLYEM